jgi:hypothetical protein
LVGFSKSRKPLIIKILSWGYSNEYSAFRLTGTVYAD